MSRRRRQETFTPLAALFVVAVLAVAVLPSALRPPPDQANASAALSPDAPPEESPDAIISSLQQAGSSTAGAAKSQRTQTTTDVTEPPPPPPPEQAPSRGQCFGDPPRQTESIYSPDCKPAFVGDNGGATYKNVSPDLVRLGLWHVLGMPARGPIPRNGVQPDDNAAMRTWKVFQTYFNQRYETYGRFVQLVAIENAASGSGPAGERATAVQADEDWQVLMSDHLNLPFCDELVRRQLVCYNNNSFPDEIYERHAPLWYGYFMRGGQNDRIAAEYICKRVMPYKADYADGDLTGDPRKLGVIYDETNNGRVAADYQMAMQEECGQQAEVAYDVIDPGADSARTGQYAEIIADMKIKGITTIHIVVTLTEVLLLMQAAEEANYYPEWVNVGNYGLDNNLIGLAFPAKQAANVFGMSGWELPRPAQETDCYQAYHTVDPNNDPDASFCGVFFLQFQQMMIAIHEAGPDLNPETIKQGFYNYGIRFRPEQFAVQGGYGPGDHAFVDKYGEIWWSATRQDPDRGNPGAYVWTNNAARYAIGEIPEGPPTQLFKDGITTPP